MFTPPGEDADLDALPRARVHRWLDVARYERHGATVPIQTKRGYVYKCVYCTYRNVEGWGYRLRDPRAVAGEIAELRREAGVTDFDFVDSTFNSPPGHAIDVCEAVVHAGLRVQLETMNFTPASCSGELLAAMRAAGSRTLGITAESASDPVLARLEKGFDAARVRTVAEQVSRAGLRTLWIFLIGGPARRRRRSRKHWRSRPAGCAQAMRCTSRWGFAFTRARRCTGSHSPMVPSATGIRCWPQRFISPPASIWPRPCVACGSSPPSTTIHVLRRRAIPPLATADTLRVARAAATPALALYRALPAHGACGSRGDL